MSRSLLQRYTAFGGGGGGGGGTYQSINPGSGITNPLAYADNVATSTGLYTVIPLDVLEKLRVQGVVLWAGNASANNGGQERIRLFDSTGTVIVADTGLVNPTTNNSHRWKVPFPAPFNLDPGQYFLVIATGSNHNYAANAGSFGRLIEIYTQVGAMPATINPNFAQTGSNSACVLGALY